jgi:hypothetical protein
MAAFLVELTAEDPLQEQRIFTLLAADVDDLEVGQLFERVGYDFDRIDLDRFDRSNQTGRVYRVTRIETERAWLNRRLGIVEH